MTDEDVERLMHFEGIVKNRLKIKSTITNARQFLAIQKEFGSFYDYTLSFFPDRKPIVNTFCSLSEIPASSPESDAMSKDMKKREIIVANAAFELGLEKTICHMGQPSLAQAATNCEKRAIGTNGGFGYRAQKEGVEIALLDSVILAYWMCRESKEKKKQRISY